MADQWFYRVFGEVFGPMPLEKLKELADSGTIQALDDVRSQSSDWVAAATIDELGLSTSERRTAPTMTATSLTDLELSPSAVSDEWYYQMGDHELGPISFDELIAYAEEEQITADDQVKLGANGKWRRAGSIGRLMAAIPYKAVEKTIVPGAPKPIVERPTASTTPQPDVVEAHADASYIVAYEQPKAKVAESMIARAQAAFKAAEEQAQAMIAWTSKPDVDRSWWGWANGVEFGPVEFSQVYGLAKSGQLKPSDMVRNGQYGHYVPAANLPGLFNALAALTRAAEQRDLAISQAKAAAAVAPAAIKTSEKSVPATQRAVESSPRAKSDPTTVTRPAAQSRSNPTVDVTRPQMRVPEPKAFEPPMPAAPVVPPKPAPAVAPPRPSSVDSSANSGFSSSPASTMSSYGASRPAPAPYKAPVRKPAERSRWLSDMFESLKEPKALGSIATIALVLLIVGWGFLPKSRAADIKRYQMLKQCFDEVRAKRNSPGELATAKEKLAKAAKQIAEEVKKLAGRDDPAKQALLWASRDEVPRFIEAGMVTETLAEKNLVTRLQEASYELGLEQRPPIQMAQSVAPSNDD